MKEDLIERYLYAVTKRLPPKQREDVSRELRSLIDDMLIERSAAPTDEDLRVVLMELGSPQALYEKYAANSQKCLIGQPYYTTYIFVLKIVLACIVLGMTVSSLVLQLMEPQVWYSAVGQWLSLMWQGVLSGFALVTALFAFFHYMGIRIDKPFALEDLPPVPVKRQEVSVGESAGGIILTVVFLIVFLAAPQMFCAAVKETGQLVPVFQTAVIRSRWYILVLFAMAGIAREGVKLMEKRYDRKVMVTAIGCDFLSAVFGIWWLGGGNIINPEFLTNISQIFDQEAQTVYSIFANFNLFLLAVILLALVLDAVDTTVRTLHK